MDQRITADYGTLMRQAMMTAHDYMRSARNDIDDLFGPGFAKGHPELVAAYMETAARDFAQSSTGIGTQHVADALDHIAGRISDLGETIRDGMAG